MKRFFMLVLMVCAIDTAFSQTIVAAEYFFDADPGPGKAFSISVGTTGTVVNFTATIPENLTPGFHWIGVRTKDSDGKWALFERRNFYLTAINAVDMPAITAAEYFFDHDPGAGKASPLAVNLPGNIISQSFSIPLPADTTAGNHLLAIRIKDAAGHWSLFEKDSVKVTAPAGSIICPGNVTVDPFTDNCKAVVNHIDAVGLPEDDSSYTYTLTGATTGSGIGTASGQLFNAGVTTVTYALISSPTVNCSFTVTVKSSVTPTAKVNASGTNICEGTTVNFTCTYTGGGFITPAWQWMKNGINVGTNSNLYRDSTLKNNDTITVALTSAISCANPHTVISPPVVISVQKAVTPSVSISASATTVCPGQTVVFTANPTNSGIQPVFEWVKNGVVVGGDSVYQTSSLANGDSVYLRMYNNSDCVIIYPARSNVIHITTSQAVMPSVNISSSATTVCPGTLVNFSASPTNGGNPSYQWQLNGNNIPGATGSTYQSSSLANGDKIKVVMTSSLACASPSSVASNEITITVTTGGTASVTIAASQTTICSGQQVTFTATPTNGGTNPVYEWTVNNNAVNAISSNVYQTSSLKNGDVVRVTMQPSGGCAGNGVVYSNSITMTVTTSVIPLVSINAPAIDICSGQEVTFTADATNGGSNPSYQWKLNGVNVGGDSAVFKASTLKNADTVKVVMTSSLGCANPQTVTSNRISMDVSPSVTPSVSIAASATTICAGTPITFSAAPTNGGSPTYEWRINGSKTGTNSNSYQSSTLANGDSIAVYMTSSLPCANPKTVKSNVIVVTVNNAQTFYRDLDGDGYGSSTSGAIQACDRPSGYVSNNNDCDDNNKNVHPGAIEICRNGVDDNCNGIIDENCTPTRVPLLMTRTYPVKEGDFGETILNAVVMLDTIATVNSSVHYSTEDEDAKAGKDYVAASGVLAIPAGSSTATIPLKIIGDVADERNEQFIIRFSQPSGLRVSQDSTSRIIILDDDHRTRKPFLVIPNLIRRNQPWQIQGIDNFQNEIFIMDRNGKVVRHFVNYNNRSTLNNLAVGLYFYRVQLKYYGEWKTYAGRLLIIE